MNIPVPKGTKRGIKDKARLYGDIKNVEYFDHVALVQLVTDLAIFFHALDRFFMFREDYMNYLPPGFLVNLVHQNSDIVQDSL